MAEDNIGELGCEGADSMHSDSISAEENACRSPDASVSAARFDRRKAYVKILCTVCASLIIAAALVALITHYFFPVMRIYGSSMSSTLIDGDIVIVKKTVELERGDICAFYYDQQILCKRVVGVGGDVIEIDDDGTVIINGEELKEPYIKGKSLGECDIEFPYTVPDGSYFVLGDNRRTSVDSRSAEIGCISEDQMLGKLVFCVLPLPSFGAIE